MRRRKTEDKTKDKLERNKLAKVEQFYVNAHVDNLKELVEIRKKKIVEDLAKFSGEDEEGNRLKITPFVLNNYFFKSVSRLTNVEPDYNSEQLGILWDLYNELVMQVNMKYMEFTPTLSHFCKFIGITTQRFKSTYKESPDEGTRIVAGKIYDQFYDENVTMAELGLKKSRPTQFRIQSEMGIIEKQAPKINVHTTDIDIDGVNERLNEILGFSDRVNRCDKKNIKEAQIVEKD